MNSNGFSSKIFSKPVAALTVAASFIYGLILPFCWGNDPRDPLGTLSLLCENRKIFLWIWSLAIAISFFIASQYLFRCYNFKNRVFDVISVLSVVGAVTVCATLNHSIADWNPKRVTHWIGAIFFGVCIATEIILFMLMNIKKDKKLIFGTVAGLADALLMLFWLLVFGKSGLLELIPTAILHIIVFTLVITQKSPAKSE